jgi:hypothetical protein
MARNPRSSLCVQHHQRRACQPRGVYEALRLTPFTHKPTLKKRAAFVDPERLREDDDRRIKRTKLDQQDDTTPAEDNINVASSVTVSKAEHSQTRATASVAISQICSSCLDAHPARDTLQLPCKYDGDVEAHAYCRDCLVRLFECAITDSSHFPPRCCSKIIPLLSCILLLPPAVISRFEAKREELETSNRTYCSNSTCSKWVRPANIIAGIATCVACNQKTCATCKNQQHDGLCLEDRDVVELMNVAKAKRWQTCPNCKEMVELGRGCYHIT